MCDTKRCTECPYYRMNRSLEYYQVPECSKANREITFNGSNGWDRMCWCPMNDKREESKND